MKFLSTIVVLLSTYNSINSKSTGMDLIESVNQILLSDSTVVNRQTGPDLTPIKNEAEDCFCLAAHLCNNNLPIKGKPCTDNTCSTSIRIRTNDGSCGSGTVRCCTGGIAMTTMATPAILTSNKPNLDPGITPTSCPCVPSYQCENGIPCIDGCDAINEKINDGTCSDPTHVRCCNSVNNARPTRPNLDPGKVKPAACPCVPYYQCENGTLCTDGCDGIDVKINDGACPDRTHVRCCNRVTTTLTNGNLNKPDLSPGNKTIFCPCLQPYQCENGIPCTDGCDAVDIRTNDGTCPLPLVPCCGGVHNGHVYPVTTPTNPNPTPGDNMSFCPCIPYFQCNNGAPCTDGCDVINVRINDGTCSDSTHVRCCQESNGTVTTASPMNSNTPDLSVKNQIPICPCISHFQCYNGTPCTEGCGVIDMRINHDSCKSPNVLCCTQNNTDVSTPTKSIDSTPPSVAPTRKGCGVHNPNGIGFRLIDTKTNLAQFGEFPWMVAILWEDQDTSDTQAYYPEQTLLKYQCGGSLIHPQVVLTSAHCVVSREKTFQVRAGEWDIKNTEETYPHQDRSVEKVIRHPEYYSGGLYNDIALLILKTPVNITKNVDTVCLPAQDEILGDIRCFTSGWGKNVLQMNGQYETTLKKVKLPIVQKDICQTQLRTARLQDDFILHESFVCAGGEKDKDACEGDGGSPLACPFSHNPRRYFQAGIVSWGMGCGLENVPGLYANVARFRNWVDEHMIKLGYDTSYYIY